MIEISIPGRGDYAFRNLVLDLNGTIALDGEIIEGVKERLDQLGSLLSIAVVTADMRGSAQRLEGSLGIRIHRVERGGEDAQKLAFVRQLGCEETVAIGNGSNDVSMLRECAIGICVLGREGAAVEAMMASDLVAPDINAALELLLDTKRLIASLRK